MLGFGLVNVPQHADHSESEFSVQSARLDPSRIFMAYWRTFTSPIQEPDHLGVPVDRGNHEGSLSVGVARARLLSSGQCPLNGCQFSRRGVSHDTARNGRDAPILNRVVAAS